MSLNFFPTARFYLFREVFERGVYVPFYLAHTTPQEGEIMPGIFGSGTGLFGAGKSNIDQQIQETRDNPEFSDVHKEREIKKLELAKAQIIEGAERAGHEVETFERDRDLFSD